MSAKSKSSLSGSPIKKAAPATPRISKGVAKPSTDSVSPLPNGRLSIDRSPGSVTSKPKVEKASPKLTNPTEKKITRSERPSLELQDELTQAQEDLKKANEKLALVEKEKENAYEEVKEVKRLCDEAHEKLMEALVAQRVAEENSEIEKFRALEMGSDVTDMKEEELDRELEAVRNQHNADVTALLSTNQELANVKQELLMTCAAKNQALKHAEDATKIAEIHVEKVEALSAELLCLKQEVDSRIKMESKLVSELKFEKEFLWEELEKAMFFKEKLMENEAMLEEVNVDLEAAKIAEFCARTLVGEISVRVEELTFQVEEANKLETLASESLDLARKHLAVNKELSKYAKSEIAVLCEKVELLENLNGSQKCDLELAREEASEVAKKAEFLESELTAMKEEKIQALKNEHLLEGNLKTLLEEKDELLNELGKSREEGEKGKKALEILTLALQEVSSESREVKEKLISVQVERENYEARIEDLKLVSQSLNAKQKSMLEDANNEINVLRQSIEQSKQECHTLRVEFEEKEQDLMHSVKQTQDEKTCLENEINRLTNLLKVAEEATCATRDEGDRWRNSFKEAASEIVSLKGVVNEVKVENTRLSENLKYMENELKKVLLENEDLHKREAISHEKIEELSRMIEDNENGEVTDSEKDYDVLPKVIEFSEQNGTGEEKPIKLDYLSHEREFSFENSVGKIQQKENVDSAEMDLKMWESCKIDAKDFSPDGEQEHESFDEEAMEGGDLSSSGNGGSPQSKASSQKKKKALLQKFGSLLKKKGINSQK